MAGQEISRVRSGGGGESGLTRLRVISSWSALVKGKGKEWFARTDSSQGLIKRRRVRLYIRCNVSHIVHSCAHHVLDIKS